jgi:hypothetical protein
MEWPPIDAVIGEVKARVAARNEAARLLRSSTGETAAPEPKGQQP